MALTYSINFVSLNAGSGEPITSGALSVLTGDFLTTCLIISDNSFETAWDVTNTGTAIAWTERLQTIIGSNCKIVMWSGIAGATPPTTVTVDPSAGSNPQQFKALCTMVHTGQHATTPLPAGNLFLIASGTDISKIITPTSAGSCLWLVVGDWAATTPLTAGTNCTLAAAELRDATAMTAVPVRPTTQPCTDANAFTIAEADTGGTVIGIAFEVQAAAGGGDPDQHNPFTKILFKAAP